MLYVLKYGVVDQDEYVAAEQEYTFGNKRKALKTVRELLKSLPVEWKEVTDVDQNLLAFEAEEVNFRGQTGVGYITLYTGQPPETHASWDDLPPFECF